MRHRIIHVRVRNGNVDRILRYEGGSWFRAGLAFVWTWLVGVGDYDGVHWFHKDS